MASENMYRSLFELSLDLMGVANLEGRFLELNPAWESLLGYTLEELRASPFVSFVHPEDQAATIEEANNLAQGAKVSRFTNRYRTKDGSYKWIEWNSTRHEDQVYFVARDATPRKKLEEDLRATVAELRESGEAIKALSAPILQVAEGVLLLPVVGQIDARRTARMMEMLLEAVVQSTADVTILDLTGVAEMDADSASHLLSLVSAAALLGSQCVVSGIQPGIATILVELGIESKGLRTFGSLAAALSHALGRKAGRRRTG